jgi:hypothetical protein
MKLILFVIALLAVSASGMDSQQVYTGVITDTMCGADHSHMGVNPEPKCVRECVRAGTHKYALLTADKKLMVLSDQATPEKYAGQNVKVTGTLYQKTGILKVTKIEAAR